MCASDLLVLAVGLIATPIVLGRSVVGLATDLHKSSDLLVLLFNKLALFHTHLPVFPLLILFLLLELLFCFFAALVFPPFEPCAELDALGAVEHDLALASLPRLF